MIWFENKIPIFPVAPSGSSDGDQDFYNDDFPLFNIDFSPLPFDSDQISEIQPAADDLGRKRVSKRSRGIIGNILNIEDAEGKRKDEN